MENLQFEAPKGKRVMSRMIGFESENGEWVWNLDSKEWVHLTKCETFEFNCSSHRPCKSVRPFKRMLKKAPEGVSFILHSKYSGHNVYGTGQNKFK